MTCISICSLVISVNDIFPHDYDVNTNTIIDDKDFDYVLDSGIEFMRDFFHEFVGGALHEDQEKGQTLSPLFQGRTISFYTTDWLDMVSKDVEVPVEEVYALRMFQLVQDIIAGNPDAFTTFFPRLETIKFGEDFTIYPGWTAPVPTPNLNSSGSEASVDQGGEDNDYDQGGEDKDYQGENKDI